MSANIGEPLSGACRELIRELVREHFREHSLELIREHFREHSLEPFGTIFGSTLGAWSGPSGALRDHHCSGFAHRDLKPENIAVACSDHDGNDDYGGNGHDGNALVAESC